MSQYNTSPDLVAIIQALTKRVAALENTQDTGWVPLTLVSPWTPAAGFFIPSVRLIGNRGYFSGGISSGVSLPPAQFTTISLAFRPKAEFAGNITDVTGSIFNTLTIDTSGNVSLSSPPSSDTFCLDPISYRLS